MKSIKYYSDLNEDISIRFDPRYDFVLIDDYLDDNDVYFSEVISRKYIRKDYMHKDVACNLVMIEDINKDQPYKSFYVTNYQSDETNHLKYINPKLVNPWYDGYSKLKNKCTEKGFQSLDITIPKEDKGIPKYVLDSCFDDHTYIETLDVEAGSKYLFTPRDSNIVVDKTKSQLLFGGDKPTLNGKLRIIGPYAFKNRVGLTKINLKKNLLEIKEKAFYNCLNLEDITLPDSLVYIGDSSFFNCKKLKKVTLPMSVINVGSRAFEGCSNLTNLVISDGVRKIGNLAFKDCISLKELDIPGSLKKVSEGCFENCLGLEKLTLNEGIIGLKNACFSGCKNLEEITFPESLEVISKFAFKDCKKLRKIVLKSNVRKIDFEAFIGCKNLTEIELDKDNKFYKIESNKLVEIATNSVVMERKKEEKEWRLARI